MQGFVRRIARARLRQVVIFPKIAVKRIAEPTRLARTTGAAIRAIMPRLLLMVLANPSCTFAIRAASAV
jgi:hypothetical protein